MKITKSMLAAGAVTTVAVASLAGMGTVSAQSNSSGNGIVDRIATTFGLNKDEVQTVFDEQRTEMQAEHEAKQEENLQALVDDGTLTEDQKTALEAKQEEMKAARETLKDQDLTKEEMRTQMEQSRQEFESWAEGQGIDLEAVRPAEGPGRGPRGQMAGGFDSQE